MYCEIVDDEVTLIWSVHVDDIVVVAGKEADCKRLFDALSEKIPPCLTKES